MIEFQFIYSADFHRLNFIATDLHRLLTTSKKVGSGKLEETKSFYFLLLTSFFIFVSQWLINLR